MRYALALTLSLAATTASAALKVQHQFQSTVPRAAVRRIIVDVPAADLTIRNGTADQLSISGTVTRQPDSERSRAAEQAIVDDTTVEIYISKEEAVLRRRFGPAAQSWRASSFSNYKLTLELPADVDLNILTTTGEISLDGSVGDLNIDLRAGEVTLRVPKPIVKELNASARVGEVRTRIGDEIIERQGVLPGKARYSNPNGRSVLNVHVTAGNVNVQLY